MKKSGFTLIELIFVILIIGVLSAVAVPKFANLKQNAEASNVLKVANDSFSSIPPAYVNLVDLEEKYDDNNVTIESLVNISGKNWTVVTTTQDAQTAIYQDDTAAIATLTFNPGSRLVTLLVTCTNFKDATTQAKCTKLNGSETSTSTLDF